MNITGRVLTTAFLLEQSGKSVSEMIVRAVIRMSTEELDAFKYYLQHGSFLE